jgi:VIT1/CCC1 family predicted Fe2+/Mn2+ transporter
VKHAKTISMTPDTAASSHQLRLVTPQRERAPRQPATGVVAHVKEALRPKNRLANTLGGLLGGFVPLATYVVSHGELDAKPARCT